MGLLAAVRPAVFIDVAAARQFAEQAAGLARQLGDDRLLTVSLAARCAPCFIAGEPEAGRPFGQDAVERACRLGDDGLLGLSLVMYVMTIDPARSGTLVAEAMAWTERSGDHLISSLLHGIAGVQPSAPGTSPPPGLTWTPRREPGSRSDTRTPP
jgi:hypothetical protein